LHDPLSKPTFDQNFNMKLVFATNNLHKLEEVQGLMPAEIELLTLKDIGCFEDIEETATTLEGNAQIKTDHVKQKYGYDCFGDDTGLEVEALNGAPGVYSARYAGEDATFSDNVEKMLFELKNHDNRKARFRTIVSLYFKGQQYFFEGICDGRIEEERYGTKGFGYDPIFKPEGFDLTFAQMDMATKGKISHRGLAIDKLINFFNKLD
jgi:XTP/dITP diphosphohydrolase